MQNYFEEMIDGQMVFNLMKELKQTEGDYVPVAMMYGEMLTNSFEQMAEATENNDHSETLRGLCEMVWSILGYSYAMGYDLPRAFREVSRAKSAAFNNPSSDESTANLDRFI